MVANIKEHTKMLQFIVSSTDVLIIGNALGLFASMGFNPAGIIDISKKFVIETRIHSGLRFNLLIMIGRTRDRRAGLIPHLLTSGSIPSLMVCLS
jgi:hypothetical protein